MIWCQAATISWALVFSDPAADTVTMEPIVYDCYANEGYCLGAQEAANNAFALDRSVHKAHCEPQPAVRSDAQGGPMSWKR
jgi:hypothetical protein